MTTTHPAVHASSLTLWNIIYSTSRGGLFALLPMIPTHMIFFSFLDDLYYKNLEISEMKVAISNFGNSRQLLMVWTPPLDVFLKLQSLKTAWNLPHRVTANSLINKNSRNLLNSFHNLIDVRMGTSEYLWLDNKRWQDWSMNEPVCPV